MLGFDLLLWKDRDVGQESSIPAKPSNSNPSVRLAVLLLMLGVCVFLWGFSYKISLYNLNQRSLHTVPDAKLLSKNEDHRAIDGVQQVLTESPQAVVLLPVFAIVMASAAACTARWYGDERNFANLKPPSAVPVSSLYFRPPPIQSVL